MQGQYTFIEKIQLEELVAGMSYAEMRAFCAEHGYDWSILQEEDIDFSPGKDVSQSPNKRKKFK